MPRRNLLALAALVGILAITACSEVTAPKSDTICPVSGGGQVCTPN